MADGSAHEGPKRRRVVPRPETITGDLPAGFDFFSSVASGVLIGLVLDWWLGTAPVLVIIAGVAGFVAGFAKLWASSAVMVRGSVQRTRWDPPDGARDDRGGDRGR